MKLAPISYSMMIALLLGTSSGCVTKPSPTAGAILGESVVLVGEQPARLGFLPKPNAPLCIRSTYLPATNTVDYVAGRDFVVDYTDGSIRRAPGSRLPDFRTNMLFGVEDFDHSKFPGFGNRAFFAFVDYTPAVTMHWPIQPPAVELLKATRSKLIAGQPVKIVAFGDSITAGGDATDPKLIFWQRWADQLQRRYPQAKVTVANGATGGDSTVQGLLRLQAKVLDARPDLVLIGFGMNDHNKGGVPIPQFEQNLKSIISRIHAGTGAEVILFSAFPPNPRWKFGTHRMPEYAAATERVARETACAFADVFGNWQALAARKKPEDLLGNNINHPNDFGHWIYFRVLSELGL